MGHPPQIPVWLRWEQSVIYFVTICVANREPVLANERAFRAFKAAVAKLQRWTVLAAVLMPDHLHVIVSPTDARDAKLGNFSAALNKAASHEVIRLIVIVDQSNPAANSTLRLVLGESNAVQDNPVRAGLVKRWADWPYRIGLDE